MPTVTFTCPGCGKTVRKFLKSDREYQTTYCNRECYTAWRRKNAKTDYKKLKRFPKYSPSVYKKTKIIVTKDIDLFPDFKPTVGAVYDAEKYIYGQSPAYVIVVNGHRVNIRYGECEEVL